MSAPKHLWSGDWQGDSDELAQELARRRATAGPQPPQAKQPPAPPIPPTVKAIPRPTRERRAPWRAGAPTERLSLLRAKLSKPPWLRAALLAACALLIVAGAAYGLTSAIGSGGSHKATANAARPWLGVELESLPIDRVVITAVVPGGPADTSGLGPGDVITSVNNRPIDMPGDVTAAIAGMHPGDRVGVQIERGGLPLQATVTLAARRPGYP